MSVTGNPEPGKFEETGVSAIVDCGSSPLHRSTIAMQLVVGRVEYNVPFPNGFKVLTDDGMRDELLRLRKVNRKPRRAL